MTQPFIFKIRVRAKEFAHPLVKSWLAIHEDEDHYSRSKKEFVDQRKASGRFDLDRQI
jgi:hypothetical protein